MFKTRPWLSFLFLQQPLAAGHCHRQIPTTSRQMCQCTQRLVLFCFLFFIFNEYQYGMKISTVWRWHNQKIKSKTNIQSFRWFVITNSGNSSQSSMDFQMFSVLLKFIFSIFAFRISVCFVLILKCVTNEALMWLWHENWTPFVKLNPEKSHQFQRTNLV